MSAAPVKPPKKDSKKIREETRNAMDKAGNVGQYLKYFNFHFERQNSLIKRLCEEKELFDEQIRLLNAGHKKK